VVYGEALAILAGDALLTQAFEVVARDVRPPEVAALCCLDLARAAGAAGMVGGQVADLEAEGKVLGSMDALEAIHRRKTGALLECSLSLGARIAEGTEEQRLALTHYGRCLGLAFQITDDLLDVRGFNLNSILEIEPAFLEDVTHEHDDEIGSFAWREDRPFDLAKLEDFLDGVIRFYGADLLRYKGVLNIAGEDTRMVFQGVHMMMGGSPGRRWLAGEKRTSTMVFIGRNLPRELLEQGLALCVEGAAEPVAPGTAAR
jgi:hypothetical protein